MFEFLNLKTEAFGLNITDRIIKVAKIKNEKKRLSLASFGEKEIGPGVVREGEIKDEDSLAKSIRELIFKVKGEKLGTNYVFASLPEEHVFLQIIQLPIMEERDLKKAACFEVENHIPLPLEEVYFDCQLARPFYDHLDHLDVLVIAVPKKIVDPYVRAIKKAGLIPKALETESQAISRALVANETSPCPTLLIDFAESKTNLIFFSGYSLRYAAAVPASYQKFIETISSNLKVDLTVAEQLLTRYGIGKRDALNGAKGNEKEKKEKEIFVAVYPLLQEFLGQISSHLEYYQSHTFHEHLPTENKGVEKIIISGKGATIKGLAYFIASELKMPVEIANPWINILPKKMNRLPPLSYKESLSYTTALGLALRDTKEEISDI
jgi:type IV pilus assembly protein PilM